MKKINLLALSLIATVGAFTSCSNDDFRIDNNGEGKVNLDVILNNDVKVESRATGEDIDALKDDLQLYIYSSKGLIRKYHKTSEIPQEGLWLVSGDYQAVVWAGDSTDASYTHKYFMGKTNFTVSKGSNEAVEVVGKIQNTVASVVFPESLKTLMPDLKMTIGTSAATLDFDYNNFVSAKGYFMIPQGETALSWTLTGTNEDGSQFRKTGSVSDAKGATEYQFNIKYDPSGNTGGTGGATLSVDVDESEIPVQESITMTSAPKIQGSGFDITQPVFSAAEKFETKISVYVTASAKIESIVLNCDNATGWDAATGITGSSNFDFYKANASVLAQLKAAGVYMPESADSEGKGCGYNETTGEDIQKIVLSKAFLNKFVNGSYNITITATDVNKKSRSAVLDIEISEASVVTGDAIKVRQISAEVSANIAKSEATGFGFEYRVKGTSDWSRTTDVTVNESVTAYSAVLPVLNGTAYEYRAFCDGYVSSVINTFTTKPFYQFPNAGFEDWQTSSTPYLVYASGDDMYWDTGNHGSATMGKNITTPDGTIKHSGNYSIKLESQFVGVTSTIGKFAAGNVFIGDYIGTDGTDGVLGFGRALLQDDGPRPVALHGWVKYSPGSMEYGSNYGDKNPLGVQKGDTDKGKIYIVLTDETLQSTTFDNVEYKFPFIIKTKGQAQLFDENASHIMGYGDMVWDASTSGDGLVEFTIPITYRKDGMPSYVAIVASASYLGDYFIGGKSTMWLDDLELVYE